MKLPIKTEAIVYRKKSGIIEYLLIKRIPEDGGFWQPVTGTLEDREKLLECMKREISEETGVTSIKKITKEIHRFDWKNKNNETILEFVFGVEVEKNCKITLSHEHTDFTWECFEKALDILEKENNKNALELLDSFLHHKGRR